MLRNFLITSFRNLFRNKSYLFLSVLGLSLGIACVIALYTIINFQNNFDKHQANYDQVYRVVVDYKSGDDEGTTATVPHPLANGIREALTGVEAISNTYLLSDQINVAQRNGGVKKVMQDNIAFAQSPIFDILTFEWLAGGPQEDNLNAAYISTTVAKKLFDTTVDYQLILGESITLANKHTLIVEGVYSDLPRSTDFPFSIITSYEMQEGVNPYFGEGKMWNRLNGGTQCILKLAAGVNPDEETININNAFDIHNTLEGYQLHLQPMSNIHSGNLSNYSGISFEPKYTIISYTLALVLAIIGCINFINLTTARAIKRAREVGIRKVMGGLRSELVSQFMLETLIITLISVTVGFFLGGQILYLFGLLTELSIGISDIPIVDWAIFVVGVSTTMTLLSGLYPALVLSRFSPLNAIKIRISNIDRQSKFPLRKVLVGLQFGFSISLIIGAIVIFSQMKYMKGYNMGFQSDGIIQLMFPEPDEEKQLRLKRMLAQYSEIEEVSLHLGSPVANTNNTDQYFNPEISTEALHTINAKNIDEHYLALFELELISGRNVTPNDPRENILITENALSQYKLGSAQAAIGKELHSKWGQKNKIIGVIKNFNAYSLQYETIPVALSYEPRGFYELAIKLASKNEQNMPQLLKAVEASWDQVYPELLIEYSFLDDELAGRYEFEEVMGKAISFFVLIALVISILGLYGLTDFMANAKRKEIGIRKVVGAEIRQILAIFAKEVALLLLVAFVIASTTSYLLMNSWLQGFEYRISLGWEIFFISFIITLTISILTMGSRSLSAAKLNPVVVLKDE